LKFLIFSTYYKQELSAPVLAYSILNQTYTNWELHICSNGDEGIYDCPIPKDERIHISVSEPSGNWGCLNRRKFIEECDSGHMLINTSCEDYYAPSTLDYISRTSSQFVYWDFSHHHFGYESKHVSSSPNVGGIDWGNFAVDTALAKSVPFPEVDSYCADGEWVTEIIKHSPSKEKIERVLFVKN